MTVDAALDELLRPNEPRDGVTSSGGEPLAQATACAELVSRLKAEGTHATVYTGYTFEQLAPLTNAAVQELMAMADVLVDWAYLAALHEEGLAFRGSSNQRVIDLSATRSTGELRLLQVD